MVNTNLTNCVEYFRTEYKYFTITKAENYLHDVWKGVSPPLKEEDIVNQWFAVIYWHKKKQSLFIGKAKRRFLQDVNGPTAAIEVECLKAHVGSGTVLQSTPSHLPKDVDIFAIHNVMSVPLSNVQPLKGDRWNVPNYPLLRESFDVVSKIDRKEEHKKFLINWFKE